MGWHELNKNYLVQKPTGSHTNRRICWDNNNRSVCFLDLIVCLICLFCNLLFICLYVLSFVVYLFVCSLFWLFCYLFVCLFCVYSFFSVRCLCLFVSFSLFCLFLFILFLIDCSVCLYVSFCLFFAFFLYVPSVHRNWFNNVFVIPAHQFLRPWNLELMLTDTRWEFHKYLLEILFWLEGLFLPFLQYCVLFHP